MVVSPFVGDFRFHPEFPISTLSLRKTLRLPPSRVKQIAKSVNRRTAAFVMGRTAEFE
jgi:hypothetical protein